MDVHTSNLWFAVNKVRGGMKIIPENILLTLKRMAYSPLSNIEKLFVILTSEGNPTVFL